ncbi:PEP-CTERM sorting domain-containing protein [Methylotenera sp.]|uniref:PEP-CTERM sorting domain-containing protein n=1 Tax=Methylotenera sp. TaxID=2051956 RepID=UPI002489FAF6|nr:PEP-CTERM sorting domain-containing protein [Methylotenera sp.]MDI1298999.1 PEP-CTERM sorting domain-containing protein [Methylotenera sp.]
MNFKLKALVAAAVVATTMSGAANALTNNEFMLVAYDAASSKTFIAALGQAGSVSAFTGSTNLSIDYSTDANWTNFISTATAGSVVYSVMGLFESNTSASTSYNAGDKLVVSSNATPGTLSNSLMNNLMNDQNLSSGGWGNFNVLNGAITGTTTGLVLGTGADSGYKVNTNVFGKFLSVDTTSALGTDLGFYSVTRPATSGNVVQTIKTQYVQGAAGSARDTWNLSSTGQLVYTATAAVPEADSWAMAMLGLGLMGFVARRRSRA